jgi:CBS domain containing-hemolysin-like protein
MLIVAAWTAIILAIFTSLVALLRAALELDEEHAEKAEALGFARLLLTVIFGIVAGQAVVPLPISWWWSALIALALALALVFGSQLLASKLGRAKFSRAALKFALPAISSWSLLFVPIALSKSDEPEQFEQELHDSVEDFSETIVREVMVPRVDMATIQSETDLDAAMTLFLQHGHSRLPVIGKNIDDVVGVLYLKDIARLKHENPEKAASASVASLARKAVFIPESKPVDLLLREMQSSSTHMAIIVDEYGGVAGLATLEDIIEEIVGEISDEYDRDVPDFEEIDTNQYRVNAAFSLIELGEHFDIELEDEDVDSLGGLLAKTLGRLPKKGDQVTVSGLSLTADRIEGRRKRLITVLVEPDENLADAKSAFEQLEKEK